MIYNKFRTILIDDKLKLIPFYLSKDYKSTMLKSYQDDFGVRMMDGRSESHYDYKTMMNMYNYLNNNGYLFMIYYDNSPVGDISIIKNSEIAIFIDANYRRKYIAKRASKAIFDFAKSIGIKELFTTVYSFNKSSFKLCRSLGMKIKSKSKDEYIFIKKLN
ncbi:MAG: GNAT family N-acetyltransferase [Ezakiella sp.]|nr:GNAT family N-acetyltransferase [Ezakiella sp.]